MRVTISFLENFISSRVFPFHFVSIPFDMCCVWPVYTIFHWCWHKELLVRVTSRHSSQKHPLRSALWGSFAPRNTLFIAMMKPIVTQEAIAYNNELSTPNDLNCIDLLGCTIVLSQTLLGILNWALLGISLAETTAYTLFRRIN